MPFEVSPVHSFEFRLDSREDLDVALEALVVRSIGARGPGLRAAEQVERAATGMGYGRAAARALLVQAYCVQKSDRAGAADLMTRALAVIAVEGTTADRVYHATLEARSRRRDGDDQSALTLLRQLEDDAWSLGPCAVQAFYFRSRLLSEDRSENYPEAFRYACHLRAVGEEISEPVVVATALSNLGASFADAGSYDEALRFSREAQELVERHRLVDLPMVRVILAHVLMGLGEHDEAWEHISLLRTREATASGSRVSNIVEFFAADVLFRRGEYEAARRLAQQVWASSREHGLPESVWASALLAELALAEGDVDEALSHIGAVRARGAPTAHRIRLRWTVSQVAAAAGQWERAYRNLLEHTSLQQRLRATAQEMQIVAQQVEDEVRRMREERDAALQRLSEVEELAVRDPLTGLANRWSFDEHLKDLSGRTDSRFCLAVIDLDHFKVVNDTYGHATGDEVLKAFSALLTRRIRAGDLACRFGGEEFALVLHRLDADQAAAVVEDLLARFREVVVTYESHRLTGLTFSAGIAEHAAGDESGLFDRADAALYAVKQSTRDGVAIFGAGA